MRTVVLLAGTIGILAVNAQKCDISSFPYKLEVDEYGQPDLSCTKTECFSRDTITKCQTKFSKRPCTGAQQFTREAKTLLDETKYRLLSKCCDFTYLISNSVNAMQASVRNGEHYIGGEIMENGRATHFNLVKDVRMLDLENGSIEYIATIYQMPCEKFDSNSNNTDKNYDQQPEPAQLDPPRARAYQMPSYQQQTPIAQSLAPITLQPTPPSAQVLEPLQTGAGALVPPGFIKSATTSTMVSLFGFPFSPMTFPANMTLPTLPPPFAFGLFGRPHGRGRARAYQAPTLQVVQGDPAQADSAGNPLTNEEYNKQVAWRDYIARNPQYSSTLVEEEENQQQLCFSGDMVVKTPNGLKEMRELELGDWVLVDDDQTSNYQAVLMWIHRIEDQWAEFYRIETSNGQFIEATGHHALFQSDCLTSTTKFTYAKDIRPGNCLVVQNADMETNHAIVVNATVIRKKGIYAPLTASGTIVVNGILASCYSDLLLAGIHQSFFNRLQMIIDAWTRITGYTSEWAVSGRELPIGISAIVGSLPQFFPREMV